MIITHGIAVAIVISGVLAVSFSTAAHTRSGLKRSGILIAIFTGMMIAGYHLVDRAAMSHADAPDPIEYLFAMHLFLVFFVALWVFIVGCRWRHITDEWHANRRSVLIVGFCVPLAYLFIIVALKMGNVTHVAAARNVGIVFSTAVGWLFLKETVTRLRAVGALFIALGIAGLVLFDKISY
jgi:drug/metabolite transporter (DMT)-like permease